MPSRHEYALNLIEPLPALQPDRANDIVLRSAQPADAEAMAVLMIEAYRDTIDYDGETVDDARGEIAAYLSGERGGPAMLTPSFLAIVNGEVVAGCLVAEWESRRCPLIAYVMTHATWKQQGLGRRLVWESVNSLRVDAYPQVRAVISAGNLPSERLFLGLGFHKIEQT